MESDVASSDRAFPRAVAVTAALAWVVALLAYGLWLALVAVGGRMVWCERGDSIFGTLSWSTLPPGPVCTWGTESEGPGLGYTLVDLALIAGLVAVFVLARHAWIQHRRAANT